MPTQEQYSDAILRAQIVNAQDGLVLINKEMSGCASNWADALCNFRQIDGALTCFTIGDYVSATAVYFYNLMLKIGAPYRESADIDPNFQPPDGIIIDGGGSSGGRAVKVVYDPSASNLTKDYLNTNYPYDEYQEGDIVYVPAAFLQYTKLQNTVDSEWSESPFNYAG